MRSTSTIGILLAIVVPALAQDDPKACADVVDDAKRLICYDLVFRIKQTTTIQGKWEVREETSKISDKRNVFVSVDSNEPLRGRFGQKRPATLMITCRESKTDCYIVFGGHFMSSLQGAGKVTYRVDKKPAKHRQFTESNDHQALGLWSSGASIPFVRELLGGDRLFVEATPYSESAVTAEFDIGGLEEALRPLMAACAWSPKPSPAPNPKRK